MTMYKKLTVILLTALIAALGALFTAYFFTRKPAAFNLEDDEALFV